MKLFLSFSKPPRSIIRLSGRSAEEVKIRFTDLRACEKLCEELFYPGERIVPTRYPKIRSARGERIDSAFLESQLQDLQECLASGNHAVIRARLMSIVSAGFYRPNSLPHRSTGSETSTSMVLRRAASQD